jgi:hypothetical protein
MGSSEIVSQSPSASTAPRARDFRSVGPERDSCL